MVANVADRTLEVCLHRWHLAAGTPKIDYPFLAKALNTMPNHNEISPVGNDVADVRHITRAISTRC